MNEQKEPNDSWSSKLSEEKKQEAAACHQQYQRFNLKTKKCQECKFTQLLDATTNTCNDLKGERAVQGLIGRNPSLYPHLQSASDVFQAVYKHNCNVRRQRLGEDGQCEECPEGHIFNPLTGECIQCTDINSHDVEGMIRHPRYGYPLLKASKYVNKDGTFKSRGRGGQQFLCDDVRDPPHSKQPKEVNEDEDECYRNKHCWDPVQKKCTKRGTRIRDPDTGMCFGKETDRAKLILQEQQAKCARQQMCWDPVQKKCTKRGTRIRDPLTGQCYKKESDKGKELQCRSDRKCWNGTESKCVEFNDKEYVRDPDTGYCYPKDSEEAKNIKCVRTEGCEEKSFRPDEDIHLTFDYDTAKHYYEPIDETNFKQYETTFRSASRRRKTPMHRSVQLEDIADPDVVLDEYLKKIVVAIVDDKEMQIIANHFRDYLKVLMYKQKLDHDNKISIRVNDRDALYESSPLLGSSSIGFMYEALFNGDNVMDDDKIWERPSSGEVYDFRFDVKNAIDYLTRTSDLTTEEEKKLLTWVQNGGMFGLYINLKVEKDGNPNLGIASRNDLVKLYLNDPEYKRDAVQKSWDEISIPETAYPECNPIQKILELCGNEEKACEPIRENYRSCQRRNAFIESKKPFPKLYMIVKMKYTFGTDSRGEGVVEIKDYSLSYIDAVFPHVNWTNNRLMMNKKGSELEKRVPPFKEVLTSIMRNEIPPPNEFRVVTLKDAGQQEAMVAVMDMFDTLGLKQWMKPEEIQKEVKDKDKQVSLPETFFNNTTLEYTPIDKTSPSSGVLVYNVKDKTYLAL